MFSSSIIFSALVFYWLYDEKLSRRHFIGLVFMIAAVVLISVGKAHHSNTSDITPETSEND